MREPRSTTAASRGVSSVGIHTRPASHRGKSRASGHSRPIPEEWKVMMCEDVPLGGPDLRVRALDDGVTSAGDLIDG